VSKNAISDRSVLNPDVLTPLHGPSRTEGCCAIHLQLLRVAPQPSAALALLKCTMQAMRLAFDSCLFPLTSGREATDCSGHGVVQR
jgi:hypothetical protein